MLKSLKTLFVLATVCSSVSSFASLICEEQAVLLEKAAIQADGPEGASVKLSTIKEGQDSALVRRIREKVGLDPEGGFDEELLHYVQKVQESLSLFPSGDLDSVTILNMVGLSAKYQRVIAKETATECARINKALRQQAPRKFMVVNIPSQVLRAYEYDYGAQGYVEVLTHSVVVGSAKAKTPLTDLNVWGVKFHPGWTPTLNITANSLVKNGKINKSWLSTMRVTNAQGQVVDRSAVTLENWNQFNYWQPPGDNSALGKFKFETDSTQAIYLHDTPEQDTFGSNFRVASSGCIRVSNVEEVAKWIFGYEESDVRKEAFDSAVVEEKEKTIRLVDKVPTFMSYQQVEFDSSGYPVYFPDVYGRSAAKPTASKD